MSRSMSIASVRDDPRHLSPNDYPIDDKTRDKLARMGLGMGINCLHFTSTLLDQQIDPNTSRLLQLTMGSGYNSFKTDVQDWYKLRREMHGSLKTYTAAPVHIDVAINAERRTESRILQRYEGQKVHTRTVYFDIGRNPSDYEVRDQSHSRLALLVPRKDNDSFSSRLDKLIKMKEDAKVINPEDSREDKHYKMVDICKDLIREENRGATHFISSVELGAKIYRTKKVMISQTSSKFSLKAGLFASSAGALDVAFEEGHMKLAANYDSRISATVDPSVKMQGARTVVDAEQERVIGYDVSPVWTLVSDPYWRKAMQEASGMYVEEELAVSRPVIAAGGPFLIKSGNYCLIRTTTSSFPGNQKEPEAKRNGGVVSQLDDTDGDRDQSEQQQNANLTTIDINQSKQNEETGDGNIQNVRLEVTDKCNIEKDETCKMEICEFYIDVPRYQSNSMFFDSDSDDDHDPIEDPDFGFYIYCKVNGTKLFLCSDSTDESKVCLVTSIPHPNAYGRFYVEFASTRRLAPVSRWPKDSLHVLRKTAYTRRRRYLVIDTNSRQLSFTAGGTLCHNKGAMCQFTVENMPMKKRRHYREN